MGIYASSKGSGNRRNFRPCPKGVQQLVLCDVIDLGTEQSRKFRDPKTGRPLVQRKVRLKWQSEHLMDDGKPYVVAKKYTLSLDRRATLRADLNAWRGRPMTDDECVKFDLERLIGVNAMANIVHTRKNGEIYADVLTLMPVKKGQEKLAVIDYIRIANRPQPQQRRRRPTPAADENVDQRRQPEPDDTAQPPAGDDDGWDAPADDDTPQPRADYDDSQDDDGPPDDEWPAD